MKILFKLTLVAVLSAFIYSCSTPELESTTPEADDLTKTFTKKTGSDLADKTINYFKAVEENVKSDKDLEYGENLTEEMLAEWGKVLSKEGGIKEAQNALKILEENTNSYFQTKQGNCPKAFRLCAMGHLVTLVKFVMDGGNEEEGIAEATLGLLDCLMDYVICSAFYD